MQVTCVGKESRTQLFIFLCLGNWNKQCKCHLLSQHVKLSFVISHLCLLASLHHTQIPRRASLAHAPPKTQLVPPVPEFPSLFNLLEIFELIGQFHPHLTRDFRAN